MNQEEIEFIKGLRRRSQCTIDEASRLHQLFAKYVNPARASVLTHTCVSCVSEMMMGMADYLDKNYK